MLENLEQRLLALEFKCRRPVEHFLSGEYRSVFRGRGIEFEEVRPYQPGDDVRTMDWKVTARTGTAHIKRYIEEREQFIYLLVDVSASMLHGAEGSRRKIATELATLITMAAAKNQDRVGLILFSDQIEQIVPPGKGRSHTMRIIDALLRCEPKGNGTDFVATLSRFGHLAPKHSIVFVLSDFLTEDYANELQSLAFRHDVNAIHIAEAPMPESIASGLVRMQDAESGQQRIVDLKAADTTTGSHSTRLHQNMLESGVNLLEIAVGEDSVEALTRFFHQRQRVAVDETGG